MFSKKYEIKNRFETGNQFLKTILKKGEEESENKKSFEVQLEFFF